MFEDLVNRLAAYGRSEVGRVWAELQDSPREDWRRFWKGTKAYLDPSFEVGSFFAPELVLLVLAESYAANHPITTEVQSWLDGGGSIFPRLRRRFLPNEPPNDPLVISLPGADFDEFLCFLDFLVLSDDGDIALSRTEKTHQIRRLDLVKGTSVLVGSVDGILCPLSDERLLQVEGSHLSIYDWDLQFLRELPELPHRVLRAACTPDGERMVGYFHSKHGHFVACFDLRTGQEISGWSLTEQMPFVDHLTISDDGSRVGLQANGRGQVFLLDENARPYRRGTCSEFVRALNARAMLALEERNIGPRWGSTYLLDLQDHREVRLPLPPSKPADVVFCGQLSIISNQEGDFLQACPIRVWDWSEEEPVLAHRFRLPKPYVKLAISGDGGTLAACCRDLNLRVYDLKARSVDAPLCGHDSAITRMCRSDDGNTLATGSTDQTVRVHDLRTGRCVGVYSGRGAWPYPKLSHDGRWLLVKSRDNCELWDLSAQTSREGVFDLGPTGTVVSLESGALVARDPATWEIVSAYKEPDVRCFECSGFATEVAVGHGNGVINIWSPEENTVLHKLEFVDEKTGLSTDIRSLSWPRPRSVNFYPNVYSNFQFSWHFRESEARSAAVDTKSSPNQCAYQARCSNGQWSFEFPLIRWERKFLQVTHNRTGQRIVWPMAGRALFRNDSELVLGCSNGEIMVFELLSG